MKLWQKAAIGIGVPLGFFLALMIAGLAYANFSKGKKKNGEVIDLEEQGKNGGVDGVAAPKPKVIKWNPHG